MLCPTAEFSGFPKYFSWSNCQNSKDGRGYRVTCRVYRRSFQVDKTQLQLMCCALVQEPECLVILEGRSLERGTGFPEWTERIMEGRVRRSRLGF